MSASTSYNYTKIQDPSLSVNKCAQCTVLDPINAAGRVVINGNALPQAPKWIVNLSARYNWPLAEGNLFVLTDWSYRSKVNFFLYESTEFTGKALDRWAYEHRVHLAFIEPGKPVQNAFVESFNGTCRDECLNENWFLSLADARTIIENWRMFAIAEIAAPIIAARSPVMVACTQKLSMLKTNEATTARIAPS